MVLPAGSSPIVCQLPLVGDNRLDFVDANHLVRAMYSDLLLDPASPPNFARFTFLDAAARRFFPDWDLAADMCVANPAQRRREGPPRQGNPSAGATLPRR